MKLWIDGASIHATARCLGRTGEPKDARDLLHTATQLIFADQLEIGQYGGKKNNRYYELAEEAKFSLKKIGFEGCLNIPEEDGKYLESVYIAAGDACARKLEFLYESLVQPDPYTNLAEEQIRSERLFDQALRKKLSNSGRENFFQEIRFLQNNGHLIMLAKSDKFWDATQQLIHNSSGWTFEQTARLASLCRISIHLEMAKRSQSIYSPSRERGAALCGFRGGMVTHLGPKRTNAEYVWRELQDLLPQALQTPSLEGLPPVAAFLADRAEGDPMRLMDEARRLRETASPLRNYLRILLDSNPTSSPEDQIAVGKAMSDLTKEFSSALANNRTDLRGAAMETMSTGLAVAGAVHGEPISTKAAIVKLSKLGRAALSSGKQFNKYQKFVVLTEMVAGISVGGIASDSLEKLEAGVSKNPPAL